MKIPGHDEKPLPEVGDRIKLDYGPGNSNTWKASGEVRAVVDGHVVVRRHRSWWRYMLVEPESWTILPYRVVKHSRKAGR